MGDWPEVKSTHAPAWRRRSANQRRPAKKKTGPKPGLARPYENSRTQSTNRKNRDGGKGGVLVYGATVAPATVV
jgi:hypothetical protein